MELYTSIRRLKEEMNGGRIPMTPLTGSATSLLDPSFTPGMGALEENEELGLRCPVRRCGVYKHNLALHIRRSHHTIPLSAIRKALGIPSSCSFVSSRLRARLAAQIPPEKAKASLSANRHPLTPAERQRRPGTVDARKSVNYRNLRNTCEAQVAHRLADLANKLGRAPTYREAQVEYGLSWTKQIRHIYGTWNNALAQCQLRGRARGERTNERDRDITLAALAAWHEHHGDLPSERDAATSQQAPALPHRLVVLKGMRADSWDIAMNRAASILNIYGGRYGLPVKQEPAA